MPRRIRHSGSALRKLIRSLAAAGGVGWLRGQGSDAAPAHANVGRAHQPGLPRQASNRPWVLSLLMGAAAAIVLPMLLHHYITALFRQQRPARCRDGPAAHHACGRCLCTAQSACSQKGFRERDHWPSLEGGLEELRGMRQIFSRRLASSASSEVSCLRPSITPERLNLLLLSEDQHHVTSWECQPVSAWIPGRGCDHHKRSLPEIETDVDPPRKFQEGRSD